MYRELRDLGHMGGLQDVLTFGLDINLTLSYRKSPSAWGFFCVSKEITGKNCSFVFALRKKSAAATAVAAEDLIDGEFMIKVHI